MLDPDTQKALDILERLGKHRRKKMPETTKGYAPDYSEMNSVDLPPKRTHIKGYGGNDEIAPSDPRPRPTNAVTEPFFKVGEVIYMVYGTVVPPFTVEYVVTREVSKFRDHPEFETFYPDYLADKLVMDLAYMNHVGGHMAFLTDSNIGGSHNYNYIFRLKEEAEAYRKTIVEWLERNPSERPERSDDDFDDYGYEEPGITLSSGY